MSASGGISEIRNLIHAEIGEIIVRHAELLVSQWSLRARQQEATADHVQRNELRDDLAKFLAALGAMLGTSSQLTLNAHQNRAAEHGGQRWHLGWSLTELIADYQLLRAVVLDHLGQELGRSVTQEEGLAIAVAFDDAVMAAVDAFVEYQNSELTDANQRLVDFVGILGHELRNPMNSISMAVDLINRTSEKQFLDEAKKVMGHGVEQLEQLVDQMLNVSRIVRGQVNLEPEKIDLCEVVSHVVDSVQTPIRDKGHDLRVDLPEQPVWILGDASRLEQVFANLLSNAVKYTAPHGQIFLCIDGSKSNQVTVVVQDNGIGISKQMLDQIFGLFTRAGTTRERNDGLGVGLAMVRKFVELHHGRVEARSDGRGKGSQFLVTLPRMPG